jgi:hypothetical protein
LKDGKPLFDYSCTAIEDETYPPGRHEAEEIDMEDEFDLEEDEMSKRIED